MVKEVLLLFKTHLDIGFTDLAANVKKKYMEDYIPGAIKVARELEGSDTPFVWTTGSWIIYEALKENIDGLEEAIKDGLIRWHGLAHTTCTETMNPALFKYDLSLSAQLDKRFGKKTIAAKMTDVPGHTMGIVPLLADAGIEFLHIGVNPATPVPKVPPVFRWKCEGKSINVMYACDYGDYYEIGDTAIGFGHTGDNLGPQSADEVREFYRTVREKYPDATVRAAGLDDIAPIVRDLDIPVIDCEIGDSWIHGAGTDPLKTTAYRALLRAIKDKGVKWDLSDSLLMVPEHTNGCDQKEYFKNDKVYSLSDLENCSEDGKKFMEKAWDEQRRYVYRAAEIMGEDLAEEIEVSIPDLTGYEKICAQEPDFEIYYELFNKDNVEEFDSQYLQTHLEWAIWDFKKPGLDDYDAFCEKAKIKAAYKKGDEIIYVYGFDDKTKQNYGTPEFYAICSGGKVELRWFGKKAHRRPEAYWLKFKNCGSENWLLDKMGQMIDPAGSLCSPYLHAIDEYIENETHIIKSLDACVVAPFGRKLWVHGFDVSKRDMWINLYNNKWNTNYPIWYSDDSKFRFEIIKK